MAAIAATRGLGVIVEDALHALVQQARAEGRTWAESGELLHVRRAPSRRTQPASGRSSLVIIDSDVVLPAPFGPTSPASEPASISRLMPATASFSPNFFHSPRTTTAGPPVLGVAAPG